MKTNKNTIHSEKRNNHNLPYNVKVSFVLLYIKNPSPLFFHDIPKKQNSYVSNRYNKELKTCPENKYQKISMKIDKLNVSFK